MSAMGGNLPLRQPHRSAICVQRLLPVGCSSPCAGRSIGVAPTCFWWIEAGFNLYQPRTFDNCVECWFFRNGKGLGSRIPEAFVAPFRHLPPALASSPIFLVPYGRAGGVVAICKGPGGHRRTIRRGIAELRIGWLVLQACPAHSVRGDSFTSDNCLLIIGHGMHVVRTVVAGRNYRLVPVHENSPGVYYHVGSGCRCG